MGETILKQFLTPILNTEIGKLSPESIKTIQDLFHLTNCQSENIENSITIGSDQLCGNDSSELSVAFHQHYFPILFKHIWSCYRPDKVEPIIPTLLTSAVNQGAAMQVLYLLIHCLKSCHSSTQIDLSNHLCKYFFTHRNGIRDVLAELATSQHSDLENENNIRCLLSFTNHYFQTVQSQIIQEDSILHNSNRFCRSIIDEAFKYLSRKKKLTKCDYRMLHNILGMSSLLGHSDVVFDLLSASLRTSSPADCDIILTNWRRILNDLSDRYFDSLISPFFLRSPTCLFTQKCLGNLLTMDSRLGDLLKKFLFMRYYSDTTILCNILGYLSLCSETHLNEFTISLVKVWSNSSSIRLTDYDQQFYISKAVTVCFSLLEGDNLRGLESEVLCELLPGISSHLESTIECVRHLGMVVGEYVTEKLTATSSDMKLTFEYRHTQHVKELIQLRSFNWKEEEEKSECVEQPLAQLSISKSADDNSPSLVQDRKISDDLHLDSDDDDELEAMPMSHDLPLTRGKQPRYVRECMEGLLATTNSKPHELDTFEACVNTAESLIYQHEASAEEVAVEFIQIILHLTAQTCVDNFSQKRMNIAVALCLTSPKSVSHYLIREFFQPNYSIAQRLDILSILSQSAQKLSNKLNVKSELSTMIVTNPSKCEDQQSWKEIIQSRLEAKTRRFASASKRPVEQSNCFIPYAGDFFFGLMESYDRKTDQTLDLLGTDSMVLSRLIYTLGVIFHSSSNAPILQRMTTALLGFLWVLRWHVEASVRRAVLFSLCTCCITVPHHFLFPSLSEEMVEWKYWLETDCERDSDGECRELACFALIAVREKFESSVKELMPPS